MRSYIFTKAERDRLESWVESGEEDDTTRMIFVSMRHDFDGLLSDLQLMNRVMRRLRSEGRWVGRGYMPRGLGKRLREAKAAVSTR